jgi:hypothetical protein
MNMPTTKDTVVPRCCQWRRHQSHGDHIQTGIRFHSLCIWRGVGSFPVDGTKLTNRFKISQYGDSKHHVQHEEQEHRVNTGGARNTT